MDQISLASEIGGESRGAICQKHGAYTSALWRIGGIEHWSKCPDCIEEGKAAQRDSELREQAERRRRAADAMGMAVYKAAMIPQRYAGKTLDGYEATLPGQVKALKIARAYVARWEDCRRVGRCLLFIGGVGTGKSHIAAGICHGVLEAGASALFRTAPDAIGMVKATYGDGKNEDEAYMALRRPDLLVLDDIGAVRLSDHDLGILYRIIQARYEDEKPMILTTNARNLTELEAILGDRLVDRALENNGVEVVFDWHSHRRPQKSADGR